MAATKIVCQQRLKPNFELSEYELTLKCNVQLRMPELSVAFFDVPCFSEITN